MVAVALLLAEVQELLFRLIRCSRTKSVRICYAVFFLQSFAAFLSCSLMKKHRAFQI